jgi:hypothetical protein
MSRPPDERSGDACNRVIQTCKAVGYYQGGYGTGDGKGLYFDCVTPLLLGYDVPDVSVRPDLPMACMGDAQVPCGEVLACRGSSSP